MKRREQPKGDRTEGFKEPNSHLRNFQGKGEKREGILRKPLLRVERDKKNERENTSIRGGARGDYKKILEDYEGEDAG